MGDGRFYAAPNVGRLALSGLIWFGFTFLAAAFGLTPAGVFGLVGLTVAEVLIAVLRVRRRHRQLRKAVTLQQDLDALKQQEFALRFELAQQDGSLRAFKNKEPDP